MEQSRPVRLVSLALGAALAAVVGLAIWWGANRPAGGTAAGSPPRLAIAGGKPLSVVVEVRNATGRAGLARQVTRLLRERGVDVIYFGSAPRTDSTRILVRRGEMGPAREVARLVGGTVVWAPDSLLRVDLTVLLGADYRLPQGPAPL